jgi:hypothetical protein
MFIDELTCIGIGDFFLYRNKGFVSNFFRWHLLYFILVTSFQDIKSVWSVPQFLRNLGGLPESRIYCQMGNIEIIHDAIDSGWEYKGHHNVYLIVRSICYVNYVCRYIEVFLQSCSDFVLLSFYFWKGDDLGLCINRCTQPAFNT